MGTKLELAGERFGRLIVKKCAGKTKSGNYLWECECKCGKNVIVRSGDLRNDHTKSCGCLASKLNNKYAVIHGKSRIPGYNSWFHMVDRCNNPENKAYKNYGGRGIKVCQRWLSVDNFFKDMGEKPKGLTIDRIDNNGNYEKDNCRWTTYAEQNKNRRDNILLTQNGITRTISDWTRYFNLARNTIRERLNKGWPMDRVLRSSTYKIRLANAEDGDAKVANEIFKPVTGNS